MRLNHPGLARLSCEECTKNTYLIPSAEPVTFEISRGVMAPEPRYGAPPPCDKCPKKSPANDRLFRLTPENEAIVAVYHKLKAIASLGGTTGVEQANSVLLECLAIVDEVIREDNEIRMMRMRMP